MFTIKAFLASWLGKMIVIPGYTTGECVAPFWKFNSLHKNEKYSANGAAQLWLVPWQSYQKVQGPFRAGDWVIWSGLQGAYPNRGNGHVAMYSGTPGHYYSENPSEFKYQPLSSEGILGALRPQGVPYDTVSPATGGPTGWTVDPGDTLSGIAAAVGISLAALRAANPGVSDLIHPGDKLKLPAGARWPA